MTKHKTGSLRIHGTGDLPFHRGPVMPQGTPLTVAEHQMHRKSPDRLRVATIAALIVLAVLVWGIG